MDMHQPRVDRGQHERRSRQYARVLAGMLLWTALSAWGKTPQEIFVLAASSVVVVEVSDAVGNLEGTGSGVVIAKEEIITNCHVAEDGKTLQIKQGNIRYAATIHYADRDRDMCQLSVPSLPAPPAALGDVNDLKNGARVVAIGAPEGLELTISEGLVSALRDYGDGSKIIQTTAPISPGSSGGGLFDETGRLIGLTTFFLKEGQNLNFALPVNWVAALPKRTTTSANAGSATIDWFAAAMALEQKKDWPGVLTHARSWTQAEPKNPAAWFSLAIALDELAQRDKSIAAYHEALRIDPRYSLAWNNLGILYIQSSQNTQAIDAYREALRIDLKDATTWYNLGNAYIRINQPTQAVQAFREALRIDPRKADAWYNLGKTYEDARQYIQAIAAYREAVRLVPQADAWMSLGNAYNATQQFALGLQAYGEAVRIDPNNADAWNNLGNGYAGSQQYIQAHEAYREALRIDPKYPKTWFNLGITYFAQGNRSGVIEAYEILRKLDPVLADRLFDRAIAPQ